MEKYSKMHSDARPKELLLRREEHRDEGRVSPRSTRSRLMPQIVTVPTYLVLLLFLTLAFQSPVLWTLLFSRLQDVAMTRCACFLFPSCSFSVTVLRLLHVSDPVFPTCST